MNKIIVAALATLFVTTASAKEVEVAKNGCYPREQVEALLNKGEFIIALRGKALSGRLSEVWLNSQSVVMVLEYNKPDGDDAKNIKEVCVSTAMSDVVYNGTAVEVLNKSLQKANPGI